MKQLEKNSLLIIAGLVLFTIMFGIGGVPLLDPDEPVYAETAREMIQFKDFLSLVFLAIIGTINRPCTIGWLLFRKCCLATPSLQRVFRQR